MPGSCFLDKSDPGSWRALNGLAVEVPAAAEAAGLSRAVVVLPNVGVAQLNGCAYCLDLHDRLAHEGTTTLQDAGILRRARRGPRCSRTPPEEILCTEGAGTGGAEFLVPPEVPQAARAPYRSGPSLPGSSAALSAHGASWIAMARALFRVQEACGSRATPRTALPTGGRLFTSKIARHILAGHEVIERTRQVSPMIAGREISHQEFSTPDTGILHDAGGMPLDGTPCSRCGPCPEGYVDPMPAPELPNVQHRPRG